MKKRVISPEGRIIEVEASDPRPAVLGELGQQASAAEIFPSHLLNLEVLAAAAGPKTYRFSVADETPFPRFDWSTGEPYMMQLRMTPAAAHLDRTKGGSIRDGHYGDQVGSTLGAEVSNGRLYVSGVRFLSGARAQEIEQGIQPQGDLPPILQNVSIGFLPVRKTDQPAANGKQRLVIVEEWEYLHLAFEPDSALYSVGPGRLRSELPVNPAPPGAHDLSTREKENKMKKWVRDDDGNLIQVDLSDPRPAVNLKITETPPGGEGPQNLGAGHGNDLAGRQAEIFEIEELADEAGMLNDAEGRKLVRDWVKQGKTPDNVAREILSRERTKAIAQPGPEQLVPLSAKQATEYRVSKAVLMQVGMLPKRGLEWDVHQQLKSEFPGANPNGGILVPARLRPETLVIDAVTPGGGAELVQPGPIDFLDLMRVAVVCRRMGARFIPATAGSMPFVRRTGGATAYFSATGTKKTASAKKFQIQEATPHRMVAVNDYSLEWLRTASLAVDAMMLQDAVDAHAPTWDWSALYGPGGADPIGISKLTGVNEVDFGNKVPTSAKLRECPRKVSDHEALSGALGFIGNGYLTDVLAETVRTSGAIDYILKDVMAGDADEYRFGNYRWRSSNQVGTTGSDYDGFFGAWQHLIFVGFGAMEIITNPYEKDTEGIVKVTVAQFVDVICRMPEAFAKFKGARLANA